MLKVQVPRDSPYGDLNARSSAKVLQQPLVAQACKSQLLAEACVRDTGLPGSQEIFKWTMPALVLLALKCFFG